MIFAVIDIRDMRIGRREVAVWCPDVVHDDRATTLNLSHLTTKRSKPGLSLGRPRVAGDPRDTTAQHRSTANTVILAEDRLRE